MGPEVKEEEIWKKGIMEDDLRDIMESELKIPRNLGKQEVSHGHSHLTDGEQSF